MKQYRYKHSKAAFYWPETTFVFVKIEDVAPLVAACRKFLGNNHREFVFTSRGRRQGTGVVQIQRPRSEVFEIVKIWRTERLKTGGATGLPSTTPHNTTQGGL